MAQRTGLEPATPGVTGRYSNQLNYHCTVADSDDIGWWVVTDSNRRHSACKADALPTELITLAVGVYYIHLHMTVKPYLPFSCVFFPNLAAIYANLCFYWLYILYKTNNFSSLLFIWPPMLVRYLLLRHQAWWLAHNGQSLAHRHQSKT